MAGKRRPGASVNTVEQPPSPKLTACEYSLKSCSPYPDMFLLLPAKAVCLGTLFAAKADLLLRGLGYGCRVTSAKAGFVIADC